MVQLRDSISQIVESVRRQREQEAVESTPEFQNQQSDIETEEDTVGDIEGPGGLGDDPEVQDPTREEGVGGDESTPTEDVTREEAEDIEPLPDRGPTQTQGIEQGASDIAEQAGQLESEVIAQNEGITDASQVRVERMGDQLVVETTPTGRQAMERFRQERSPFRTYVRETGERPTSTPDTLTQTPFRTFAYTTSERPTGGGDRFTSGVGGDISPINIGDPSRIEFEESEQPQQLEVESEPFAQRVVEDTTGLELPTERQLSQGAREFVGGLLNTDIPNERELSQQSRDFVGDVTTVNLPNQRGLSRGARRRVRRLSGIDIPNEQELTSQIQNQVLNRPGETATALAPVAVAEPTPIGEAAVVGLAGVAAASAASEQLGNQGELDVPEEEGPAPELVTPTGEPTSPTELDIPQQEQTGELEVTEPTAGELTAPEQFGGQTDPTELQLGQQLVRQRQERDDPRTITEEDILGDLGEPEQTGPSVREQQRRDDLFAPERTFPTGGSAVVGRNFGDDVTEPEVDATQEPGVESDMTVEELIDATQGQTPFAGVAPATEQETETVTDVRLDVAQQQQLDQVLAVPQLTDTQVELTTTEITEPTSPGFPFEPETMDEPVTPATATATGFGFGDSVQEGDNGDDEEMGLAPLGVAEAELTTFIDPLTGEPIRPSG